MKNNPSHNDSGSVRRNSPSDNLQLLKTTIDSSLDMIQVFQAVRSEEGSIIDFIWVLNNEASILMYGDVIGKSLLTLQPGVVEEGIFDAFKQVVETGVAQQYEKHYVHEQFNGWFYQSVVKLNDGVATTTTDITNLKKAEHDLRESKATLQDVIDAPNIGIAVYKAIRNEKGDITDFVHEYINRASLSMLGGEDFTGRLFTAHGENARVQLSQFIEVLKMGKGNSYMREADFRSRKVWFAITNTPLDSERLVHTWEDVTERKNDEKKILRLKDEIAQRAKDKYQKLFNSIDEGFCIIEVLFDENDKPYDYCFLEANNAFEKQTGLVNASGKQMRQMKPEHEQYWFDIYGKIAKTGEPARFQNEAKALGIYYDVYAFRIGAPEEHHVAILFNDITERKQREREQQYLLKLSDAIRFIEDAATIEETVTNSALGHFAADRCYYCTIESEIVTIKRDALRGDLPSVAGIYPLQSFALFRKAIDEGRPVIVDDSHTTEILDEGLRAIVIGLQIRSYILIPVIKNGKAVGLFCLVQSTLRNWKKPELELAVETAERTWAAIERAKAEEALRKSEEKYRTLFDSMEDGVSTLELIFDENERVVDYIFVELNAALTKQTGLASDIIGKRVSEVTPGLEAYWFETFERVVKTGVPERHEYYIAALDSWFDIYTARVADSNNRKVVCIYNNITERKQQQRKQAFLLKFSDTLRTLSDEMTVQETGLRMLAEFLELDRAYVFVLHPDDDRAVIKAEYRKDHLISMLGEVRMSDFPETVRQIENATIVFNDIDNDTRLSELNRTSLHAVNLQAFICASVRKGERAVIWSLAASTVTPRVWTKDEEELIEAVAERTWAAAERTRADEALSQSQKRFQSIANLVPDLLWDSEPDGFSNWYNNRWLEYTGQGFEAAIGWGWVDAIHPDDREGSAKRYAQAAKAGNPLMQEHRIRRYDGEYRWFLVSTFPIKDNKGTVIKMYGAATDIHDSKTAQEALDKAHEAYRIQLEREVRDRTLELVASREELEREQHFLEQVTDKAPLLIYVYDLGEERFTYINKRVGELIGKSEEYVYAMGPHLFQAILHPEDLSRYTAYMKGLKNLSGGQITENDFRVWNGGQFRWFRSRDSVFREEKKQVLQVIGIAEGVTYEKMLEEKLQNKGPIGLN